MAITEPYVLNGITTRRQFYPGVKYIAEHDLSKCDPSVCSLTTRPYYTLCENGDIYVVSPDLRVFYLAAGANTMRSVFPLNDRILAEIEAPAINDLSGGGSSNTSIIITWENPNGKGKTWEQIVRPAKGTPIPWRPGMLDCTAKCPSDKPDMSSYDTLIRAKEPGIMRLPFVNGYFCIQDAADHAIVFYHGELIYDGKYSANGYELKFAYGDEYCPYNTGCCPMETTTTWRYNSYPKWKKSKSGQILAESRWDKLIKDAKIDAEGNVISAPPDRTPSNYDLHTGTIAESCEYEIEYVMQQTIIMTSCEGGGGSVKRKEWYYGGSGNVKELECSKWKEEYCRVTLAGGGGDMPEEGGGGSCNSCNDPEAGGSNSDPIWKFVPKEQCTPSPAQQEEGMQMSIQTRCLSEVARITPYILGPQLFPVINAAGKISDWAYIYREQGYCRTKKDYTVIGSVTDVFELPGLVSAGAGGDGYLDPSTTIINQDIIKNFTIHSPKDFFGEWWDEDYKYPEDFAGPRQTKEEHNETLRFNDLWIDENGRNLEEVRLSPKMPDPIDGREGHWQLQNLTEMIATWNWVDEKGVNVQRDYQAPRPYEVDQSGRPLDVNVKRRWEFISITGGGDSRQVLYRHRILHWGDVRGGVIRKGIQVGDVFYKLGRDSVPDASRDMYWYWTGYNWVKGTVPFSQIGGTWAGTPEIALFYKDSGHYNLAGEECGQAKALFVGKYASMTACRNLLAVNLNAGSGFHKVLFWDDAKIWERPAADADYRDINGEPMQEGAVCDAEYMMCVYNTGHGLQTIQIWMLDYQDDTQDKKATIIQHYIATFPYNSVPNIFGMPARVQGHDYRRDKYGQSASKNYLILTSRDGQSLYVWYKGDLKKTYTDGKFSPQYTTAGPLYAVVWGLPSDGCEGHCSGNNCCDVWYQGDVAISACASVRYDGAVLDFGHISSDFSFEYKNLGGGHYHTFSVGTALTYVVPEGQAYTHVTANESYGHGDIVGNWTSLTWEQRSGGLSGQLYDWTYFDIPESELGEAVELKEDVEVCGEGGETIEVTTTRTNTTGTVHVYRYNIITQELEYVQSFAPRFTPTGAECMRITDPDSMQNYQCENGSSGSIATSKIDYCFEASFYQMYSYAWNGMGGGGSTETTEQGYGGWWGLETVTASDAGHCSGISMNRPDDATHFSIMRPDGLHLIMQDLDWGGVVPALCQVPDDTPEDQIDNAYVSIGKDTSFYIAGNSITDMDIECLPARYQYGICEGEHIPTCSCNSEWKMSCGRFLSQADRSIQGDMTYVLYFDGRVVVRERFISCCGTYAITEAEGGYTMYHRLSKTSANITESTTFGSCCGDATIVNHSESSASLHINGTRIWTKPRYGANDSGEWHVSCCGRDYFLVQRGSFQRKKANYVIDESTSSTSNGLETVQTTTININGSHGELEDGSVAQLIEIATIEYQTKPDPLSGTYTKYHLEYPKKWEVDLHNTNGDAVKVEFNHDFSYSDQGDGSTPRIKEDKTGFIPWKYDYIDAGREAYVYYLTEEICRDPRVSKIECFRFYDSGTADGLIAEACFSVFYDNPFLNVTQTYTFNKRSGGGDALSTTTDITEHFKYQPAVQNIMPLYNPDDHDMDSCDCENRSKIAAAFPNIALYVWEKERCVSKCKHNNDNPRSPFYGAPYDSFRDNLIYISDYNCATRFDRMTPNDPVDHTMHNDYPLGTDGPGGTWLSPPTHNEEPLTQNSAGDGDRIDLSGRLVTSGGNTLFVWDKVYGYMEFDVISGGKLMRMME
jgi:hypothetical protein